MTTTLTLLTFEDIVRLAEQKRSGARESGKIAGWDRLIDVARGLAGSDAATDDLTIGRSWSLATVHILGYQGVSPTEPLTIDLDPTPGVTVLHGPNGSGKSSVADAIETALHGAPRKTGVTGAGGRAPLWEREHRGRDATEAIVELTLVCGAERLRLSCRLKPDSAVEWRAQLETGDAVNDVDLAATTWGSALAGHRPVFGYAAVERQVQRAGDLQDFLEPLLAFGGCFDVLNTAINEASAEAIDAERRWDGALKVARQRVVEVDGLRERPGGGSVPSIAWPAVGDDPDEWLAAQALTDTGESVPEITSEHGDRLGNGAVDVQEALTNLEQAETSLHARLADPLRELHEQASHVEDVGTTCPVCSTDDVAWLDTLGTSLDGLTDLRTVHATFARHLGELRLAVDAGLVDIVWVLNDSGADPAIDAARDAAAACGEELRLALDRDGRRPTPAVRSAARAMCVLLVSDAWRDAVGEAVRRSDHQRQWLRARRQAVEPFVTVWRELGSEAATADSWKSAASCVRDLQNQLREDRATDLRALTATTVSDLLADVGLGVTGLTVQGTKAAMEVTDVTGQPLTLAMLSAGQRNALLLAPLLAIPRKGPFGFLVLDDPVHAFDQVRVDRLAKIIHSLAHDRRVIVLTHDERLKEHLAGHGAECEVRAVARNHQTGLVTVEPVGDMWRVLLVDAREMLQLAAASNAARSPDDMIRGLCRVALDNALRQFVVQAAVHDGRDPADDLDLLDAEDTTRGRLGLAERLDSAQAVTVGAARTEVESHLNDWNRAAHGNPSQSRVEPVEIEAAERACEALVARP